MLARLDFSSLLKYLKISQGDLPYAIGLALGIGYQVDGQV